LKEALLKNDHHHHYITQFNQQIATVAMSVEGFFPGEPVVNLSKELPKGFFQGGQQWLNFALPIPKLRETFS